MVRVEKTTLDDCAMCPANINLTGTVSISFNSIDIVLCDKHKLELLYGLTNPK